jgi:hypothetical protein
VRLTLTWEPVQFVVDVGACAMVLCTVVSLNVIMESVRKVWCSLTPKAEPHVRCSVGKLCMPCTHPAVM